MKKLTNALISALLLLTALLLPAYHKDTTAATGARIEYLSPLPGSQLVNPKTTIILGPGETLVPGSLSNGQFSVVGSSSGKHSGAAVLSDDSQTVIFKPDQPFKLGEQVQVTVNPGLRTLTNKVTEQVSFSFTIAPRTVSVSAQQALALSLDLPDISQSKKPSSLAASQPGYLSVPSDYPLITVTMPASNTAPGYAFIAPVIFGPGPSYITMLDEKGEPIYYKRFDAAAFDFKKQNNGTLTYYNNGVFYALNNSYHEIATYMTGNGYATDAHDLQVLPNGHALLLSYDYEPVDMSVIVPGGDPNATVIGLIVQEIDTNGTVVFQWRSWDHFQITDSYENLTTSIVDYVHGNAVEQDTDGNLLISSRHMSEVTKISRQTGAIIWRLGGKNNQFTFTNDSSPYFWYQHDIRRLQNGDITLFNNRLGLAPIYSEAKEYQLDEVNKTATQVWSYRNTPDAYGFAMGDAQRLPNGNTMIGWGTDPLATEIQPNGNKAFEFQIGVPYLNYRAFRFPWQGFPDTQPSLLLTTGVITSTLTYSWNGATEIGSYRVYGGDTPMPTTLIATQPRSGFETQTIVPTLLGCNYYRVMPVDIHGATTIYSNEVATCAGGPTIFLPITIR